MRLTTIFRNRAKCPLACCLLLGLALLAPSQGQSAPLTWNVGGSGDWDTTTANWNPGPTTYTDGLDDVTFSNIAGGTINLTANRSPVATAVTAASGTYTFSNNAITSGTLTKSGGGTLVMNSQYTSSGAISVTGGILRSGASNILADTAAIGGGGTWDMNGFNETIRWAGSGAVTITNMGNLTVDHPYLADRSGLGIMSGSGSLTFGPNHGTSIIQQTHTYSGGTFINAGFVALYTGGGNNMPVTGDMTISSGATFSMSWHAAAGNTRTIGALFGNGSILSSNANTHNNLLQVGNGGGTGTFGGIFSGAGSLEKLGGGIQTLNGNNTYTGTTTVTAGTLRVNGTTGAGQGNYLVSSGGTLGGSGTINLLGGNAVTIANGGTLAPGNSAGTLTINGNLILNNTSILDFELGNPGNPSASDRVVVTGDLTLDGILNVTRLPGFLGGSYTLFSYTGSFLDNDLVITDPELILDLSTPGLVNVLFVPVPEPSTLALLGLGMTGLVIKRRRSRR